MLNQTTVTQIEATLSRTSLTGTAFDTQTWDGMWKCLLACGAATAGSSPTLDVKLQSSDTSGGSYSDITGATFTQVSDTASFQGINVDKKSHKRWVKVVATYGGTSTPTFPFGLAAEYVPKYA